MRAPPPSDPIPENICNVLGGRNQVSKFLYLFIQIHMSHPGENFFFDTLVQSGPINQQTCYCIRYATHSDFQPIIMAMSKRIVAAPIDLPIAVFAQIIGMQTVGC